EVRNYGILGLRTDGLARFLSGIAGSDTVTVADVLGDGQSELPDPRAADIVASAPDARRALQNADLALVMIGGNDFMPIIEADDPPAALEALLPAYEQALEASLRAMLAVNPQVRIVVGDQYMPVPSRRSSIAGLDQPAYDRLMEAVNKLSARITAVAERLGAEGYRVDAAYPSREFVGKEATYTSVILSQGKD